MTTRLLLGLLLLATPLPAQVVVGHLVLPSYGGSEREAWPTTANQLRCWQIAAPFGITNATKMAMGFIVGGGASCVAGAAIYTAAGSTRLASISGACTASEGIISSSAVTAFSLVQGTAYRLCNCTNKTTGYYTGIFEEAPSNMNKSAVLNASSTRAFVATNPCVDGVPPATTGVPASSTAAQPPILVLED